MSRRLPVVGDGLTPSGTRRGSAVTAPLAGRARAPRPTLAIVGASPLVGGAAELARALVHDLASRGVPVGGLVAGDWEASGLQGLARQLRAAGAVEARDVPLAVAEAREVDALSDALRGLDGVRVVVSLGTAVPRALVPSLTVMVTGRLPLPSWSAEARALLDGLDVTLVEARPAFSRALIGRWPRAGASPR